MFQTIDEFAETELEAQGEAAAARRAHVEWVIALIDENAPPRETVPLILLWDWAVIL